MFENTVLRMSNQQRQQQLAEDEQRLRDRKAEIVVRQRNLTHRLEQAKLDPRGVKTAMEVESAAREQDKELDEKTRKIQQTFGLNAADKIDTPQMRAALESALAEKEVELKERAQRVQDRAAMLAGLQQLAMLDAKRTAELLRDFSDRPALNRQPEEVTALFKGAIDRRENGTGRSYPKSLDGWAESIADRTRELDAAERKLEASEKALLRQVEQAIERAERQVVTPSEQAVTIAREVEAARVAAEKVAQAVPSLGAVEQATQADRTGPEAGNAPAGLSRDTSLAGKDQVDLSPQALTPERFEATVKAYAAATGIDIAMATETLQGIREARDEVAIREAREKFFVRGTERETPVADSKAAGAERPDAGNAMRGTVVAAADLFNKASVRDSKAIVEAGEAAQRATQKTVGQTQEAKTTKQRRAPQRKAAEQKAPAVEKDGKAADGSAKVQKMQRKSHQAMTPAERVARREEFFSNLNEQAGLTRDGKEIQQERGRSTGRAAKGDGYGIG
ncbi:hypothetical protein BM43_7579 (plasmid) [Burkholderia gladioli]|uniref:Uncharacterized protein n=1 Tax=Burkholderia gladioli TaxID=28095 RepID=A0AAW3FAW6_BURGA|nr:hypothetical protein [Burkholderia gladioli]AJW93642.1 hypothetical protein BM43_7579 [Burkholderia gladioli]KGC24045.1 hypothetical protein DM48_8048 [Burkholderia gladioli]